MTLDALSTHPRVMRGCVTIVNVAHTTRDPRHEEHTMSNDTTPAPLDGHLCDGGCEHDDVTCGQAPCVCFAPHCTPAPIGCYLCTRDAGGDTFAASGHPMRLPVASGVSRGPDPTVWHLLDCGHTII